MDLKAIPLTARANLQGFMAAAAEFVGRYRRVSCRAAKHACLYILHCIACPDSGQQQLSACGGLTGNRQCHAC